MVARVCQRSAIAWQASESEFALREHNREIIDDTVNVLPEDPWIILHIINSSAFTSNSIPSSAR